MDTLSIHRSLTILEDRYRELREIAKKHQQAWEAEVTSLRENLAEVTAEKERLGKELGVVTAEKERLEEESENLRGGKEGLKRELSDAREESELLVLHLNQVQEELECYFLDSRRKDEKIHWLRGQLGLLRRMLRLHGHVQRRFLALDGRIALHSLRRQRMPWC